MKLAPKARERVRREFFPVDYQRVLEILSRWDTKACAPGERPARMHATILNLAVGNLSRLKKYIAAAAVDFRDVLWWGEYSEWKHLRCVFCKPGARVTDPKERAFLEGIRVNPRDNSFRLVYADWLEERDDPRAEYVRVLCEWLTCQPAREQELIERERKLRAHLDRGWLARIRGMPVSEKSEKS
jgi:uncharacterized protein (TIGR02996 family)